MFAAARVPAGPINRMDETTADGELLARGLFYRLDADGGEPVPQINTAIQLDGAANAPRTPPPGLGDDGAVVLRELLGRTDDEIAALAADGVI